MELQDLFIKGEYFPLTDHVSRIERYIRNEKLADGKHEDVFKENKAKNEMYVSVNFPGLITRKSSDYLFGEEPIISSGTEESSNEQKALDRITETNHMHRQNYQQSLLAARLGECFYKVRFGTEYNGAFPESYDPKRTIIEPVDPKKVYPQASPFDRSKIVAYHIAEPIQVSPSDDKYELYVESHYSGKIVYRRFLLDIFQTDRFGNILSFKISDELPEYYDEEKTNVPVPLVVHIPNTNDGTTWEGQDDISEMVSLFDELNNRISQISMTLDKHVDPAIAVPTGLLQEDGEGNTYFNVAANKVFEVLGKEDIIPTYITNSNPLIQEAFKELEVLIDFMLATSEIPAVAVGLGGGTSGSSTGLNIKWRMAGLLAKINRKRQFFEDGLKRVYLLAQMVEHAANPKGVDYEIVTPQIKFRDGLPMDETETANRMAILTNGSQLLSQKTAIMQAFGLTEEQAEAEIKRIEDEKEKAMLADPSIFNEPIVENPAERKVDNKQVNDKGDEE